MTRPTPAEKLQQLGSDLYELPATHRKRMHVPVHFFASEPLIEGMDDKVFEQAVNVASLPGIVRAACCSRACRASSRRRW